MSAFFENINKDSLINSLISAGHKDARPINDFNKLEDFILKNLSKDDVLIFLGAGDITSKAKIFTNSLKNNELKYVRNF